MDSYRALFVSNMVWIKPTVQDSQCGQWEQFRLKTTLNPNVENLSNPLQRYWVCLNIFVHFYIRVTVRLEPHVYMSTLVQMLAWEQEADGGRKTVARTQKDGGQTDNRRKCWSVDTDIPLFSMAWIRLTRAGGAVSGGVNCSLRSGIETAETTTQITVTLLAQSLWKASGVLQHGQGHS